MRYVSDRGLAALCPPQMHLLCLSGLLFLMLAILRAHYVETLLAAPQSGAPMGASRNTKGKAKVHIGMHVHSLGRAHLCGAVRGDTKGQNATKADCWFENSGTRCSAFVMTRIKS